jgi:hypothetical protein
MTTSRNNFLVSALALVFGLGALPACEFTDADEEDDAQGEELECDEDDVSTGDDDDVVEDECGEPVHLTSLDEIMAALEGGYQVRATLFYGDCTINGSAVIDATGGMSVDTYEWFAAGSIGNTQDYVAFSHSSLVLISGFHYYDYVKVRVYADGAVQVIAEYLEPTTFSVDMYEEFDCDLDMGDGGAVILHAL